MACIVTCVEHPGLQTSTANIRQDELQSQRHDAVCPSFLLLFLLLRLASPASSVTQDNRCRLSCNPGRLYPIRTAVKRAVPPDGVYIISARHTQPTGPFFSARVLLGKAARRRHNTISILFHGAHHMRRRYCNSRKLLVRSASTACTSWSCRNSPFCRFSRAKLIDSQPQSAVAPVGLCSRLIRTHPAMPSWVSHRSVSPVRWIPSINH